MKILYDLYDDYDAIIQRYNQIMPKKITFEQVIYDALFDAVENKEVDWLRLRPFQYRNSQKRVGYFWKYIRFQIPEDLIRNEKTKEQLRKENVKEDDIVNFVLLVSKSIQVRKLKKEIIDNTWTIDRLIKLLVKIGVMEDEDDCDYRKSGFHTVCPYCYHEHRGEIKQYTASWYLDSIPYGHCVACGETYDIWDVLNENGIFFPICIDTVWDLLENEKEIIVTTSERQKKAREKRKKEQEKRERLGKIETQAILTDCNEDFSYLYKKGFRKEDLIGDVLHRGRKLTGKYYSDLWRYRIIYIIRDENGKAVGLKGRRIIDSDEEWEEIIKQDEFFAKNAKYKDRIQHKCINTTGCTVNDHLFLLHHYIGKKYKRLVIVEGEKDALRMRANADNDTAVVASFGNNLLDAQLELLLKYFPRNCQIVLAYDNDAPGMNANIKTWEKLRKYYSDIRFALYSGKKRKNGEYQFTDFGDIYFRGGKQKYNVNSGRVLTESTIQCIVRNALDLKEYLDTMGIIRDFKVDKETIEVYKNYLKNDWLKNCPIETEEEIKELRYILAQWKEKIKETSKAKVKVINRTRKQEEEKRKREESQQLLKKMMNKAREEAYEMLREREKEEAQ
jgi:DNA primase